MAPARVESEETYDYIICGGGTSGRVIAGRLAELPNTKILVLEAGPDSADLENVHMPGGWSANFDCETDWNIVSEPQAALNGRQVKHSRGRFLGGCSGVNGTLCVRGSKQDYDDWELDEWTGEKMFGYMAKAETFHSKDWHKADKKAHGTSGPVHTAPTELAPISQLIKESMVDRGLPYTPDMFTTGETSHGCGDVPRTVYEGIRTTAADFITKTYRRENVTIKTDLTVDKVALSKIDAGELRATSVIALDKGGHRVEYKASKEIIVTAGTYCSPIILMRSGIGPTSELSKHGIDCLVDLPGVGKNLMDHALVYMFYQVNKPDLTTDSLVYPKDALASQMTRYQKDKTGFLSSFPFGIFSFARLDERLKDSELWSSAPRRPGRDPMGLTPAQPNVEFWNSELYGGPKQLVDFPINGEHVVGLWAMLFGQHSRGTVTLKSTNPMDNPVVDHNYLDHPLDRLVLAEACRFANEIALKGKGTKDVIEGAWPKDLTHHLHASREDWEPYLKQHTTTCYHASGTCAMGKSEDANAVLDSRLRVKGVKGLRVADCSSIPLLNQGHTQMVAYGIGEGAAELIKAEAGAV